MLCHYCSSDVSTRGWFWTLTANEFSFKTQRNLKKTLLEQHTQDIQVSKPVWVSIICLALTHAVSTRLFSSFLRASIMWMQEVYTTQTQYCSTGDHRIPISSERLSLLMISAWLFLPKNTPDKRTRGFQIVFHKNSSDWLCCPQQPHRIPKVSDHARGRHTGGCNTCQKD